MSTFDAETGLNDVARLRALRRLQLLDSPPEAGFDRITRLAAQVLGVPVCLVSLVDDKRQFFKSAHGLGGPAGEARETPLTHSFCQHVVTSGAPLAVENAREHPVVCDNLAIRDLGVQAYLGVPIHSPEGSVLGSFCVIDVKPRAWSPGDLQLVKELTGLVETEISLRASRIEMELALARQRGVLDGTDLSVIATSPEGLIEEFNLGAEQMLGYRAEELLGKETPALLHVWEEVVARAAELSLRLGREIEPGFEVFVAHARRDEIDEREWTYVRKDGSRLKVLLRVTALRDAAGVVTGFLGIARDDSERSKAQESLASLAELQRRTGEMAKVGGWELELATMQPVWSEETCRIHEVDPPVTPPLAQAINFYAPEVRPVIEAAVTACIVDGTPWDLELPLITAKGRKIWVRTQGQGLVENGRCRKLVGAFQDITERKSAQLEREDAAERFRRLGAQVPGMIYQFRLRPDGSSCCPYSSEGIREIYGVTPEAVREDATAVLSAVHPDDLTTVAESVELSARTLQPWRLEYRLKTTDGSERWVQGTAMPEREADGGVLWHGFISEVTSRKAADAKLRLNEERLRLAAGAAGVAVWEWDLASGKVFWDAGVFQIYGIEPTETMEISFEAWAEAVHPEDLDGMLVALKVLAAEGGRLERVFRIVRRTDGAIRFLQGAQTTINESRGRPVRIVGINIDITQRREEAAAVVESEARFRMLARNAPVGIFETDLAGRCLFANARWLAKTGLTEEEALGDGWSRALHPGDRTRIFGEWQAFVRGEREFNLEYRFLRRDGRVVWVTGSAAALHDAAGKVRGYLGTVSDITAKKAAEEALRESEERTRLFAEHAPASVAMFDRNMVYIVVSKKWILDYKLEGKEILGRSHYEVFPDIPERWKESHRKCLSGDIVVSEADAFERADGTKQWLRYEIRPWFRADGEIGGIVMFTQDITQQRELQESLALARDQALEASRLKSEFLATMSHEIRTPMNAVVGMAGLLADTTLTTEQEEMVGMVVGGAETLLTIINDVLDFSRIEAGQLRMESADFDFRRVVEETAGLLAPRAHEKGVELTCEFESAPTQMVLGDGGRVRQVLTNLMGNAIKFTEAGEVAVRVKITSETAQRTRLRVTVRDTGVGIPAAAQPRLFQPFMQADGSTTRRYGGTGLGLAISRQLVDLMGGEIGFESEEGKGSLFWFELEFVRRSAPAPEPVFQLPPGRRVLVVDDNETNRRIVLGQLARWDVEAEAVAGGEAALARLRDPMSGPWHLILMDWHMPAMSGLELAMAIRADPDLTDIPQVMLSSAGPQADIGAVAAAGFAAFLTKPVTAQQLGRCVARVLAAAPAGAVSPPPAKARPKVVPSGGNPLRVLLVEDNPANQRVATLLMTKMGYTVELAENGARALAQLELRKFDVVLMDCQMPVMDGFEATRRIRARERAQPGARVPIIALTAYARVEDRKQCLDAGMDDYATKPIRPAELRAALERCGLEGRAAAPGPEEPRPPLAETILDETALETVRGLSGPDGLSLLAEVVRLYLSDEPERLGRLRTLVREKQTTLLADEAHAFGGNAAVFGGVQVKRLALELELVARAEAWAEVAAALTRLEGACESLRGELTRLNLC